MPEMTESEIAKRAEKVADGIDADLGQWRVIAQFGIDCYAKGIADADARTAEQVSALEELLRQKEDVVVSLGAANPTRQARINELERQVDLYRENLWLTDCEWVGFSKDSYSRMERLSVHAEDCVYRTTVEQIVNGAKGEPATTKDGEQ